MGVAGAGVDEGAAAVDLKLVLREVVPAEGFEGYGGENEAIAGGFFVESAGFVLVDSGRFAFARSTRRADHSAAVRS